MKFPGRGFGLVVLASIAFSIMPALCVPLPPSRPPEGASQSATDSLASDGAATPRDMAVLPLCKGNDNQKWDNCVGTFKIENLGEYSGEIRGRKPQGTGVFRSLDGSVYQGEFQNGVPHGKGRFTSAKGTVYIGQFSDGVAHGEGSESAADGSRYSGQYAYGARAGKGLLLFPDGRQYEGEFKDDRIEGYGTFNFPNGDSYTGVFDSGDPTDRGIFRYANGDRYVGAFKGFKPTGAGVLTFVSGIKFIGGFAEGQPDGPGVLYDDNGKLIFEGEFSGFTAIETALRDYEEKLKSKPAVANSNKSVAKSSEPDPVTGKNTAPIGLVSMPEAFSAASTRKVPQEKSNESVVAYVAGDPLRAEIPVDSATSMQSAASTPIAQSIPQRIDTAPKSDQAVDISVSRMSSAGTGISDVSVSGPDRSATNLSLAEQQKASSLPLKCQRGGDLIMSFISCEVLATQVEIENITFPKTGCRSGQNYLADYDQNRAAPWYDLIRLFKAYFYFRPFDYRGIHHYRDAVHFLVSQCNRAGDFTIRISDTDWTWPETGDAFSSPPKRSDTLSY